MLSSFFHLTNVNTFPIHKPHNLRKKWVLESVKSISYAKMVFTVSSFCTVRGSCWASRDAPRTVPAEALALGGWWAAFRDLPSASLLLRVTWTGGFTDLRGQLRSLPLLYPPRSPAAFPVPWVSSSLVCLVSDRQTRLCHFINFPLVDSPWQAKWGSVEQYPAPASWRYLALPPWLYGFDDTCSSVSPILLPACPFM